jgi:hypothetical protein
MPAGRRAVRRWPVVGVPAHPAPGCGSVDGRGTIRWRQGAPVPLEQLVLSAVPVGTTAFYLQTVRKASETTVMFMARSAGLAQLHRRYSRRLRGVLLLSSTLLLRLLSASLAARPATLNLRPATHSLLRPREDDPSLAARPLPTGTSRRIRWATRGAATCDDCNLHEPAASLGDEVARCRPRSSATRPEVLLP